MGRFNIINSIKDLLVFPFMLLVWFCEVNQTSRGKKRGKKYIDSRGEHFSGSLVRSNVPNKLNHTNGNQYILAGKTERFFVLFFGNFSSRYINHGLAVLYLNLFYRPSALLFFQMRGIFPKKGKKCFYSFLLLSSSCVLEHVLKIMLSYIHSSQNT